MGGTAILSETPEIYGAEQLLLRRAATPEVAERLIERIRWWETLHQMNGGRWTTIPRRATRRAG
jgi:altronate hydrolase